MLAPLSIGPDLCCVEGRTAGMKCTHSSTVSMALVLTQTWEKYFSHSQDRYRKEEWVAV